MNITKRVRRYIRWWCDNPNDIRCPFLEYLNHEEGYSFLYNAWEKRKPNEACNRIFPDLKHDCLSSKKAGCPCVQFGIEETKRRAEAWLAKRGN